MGKGSREGRLLGTGSWGHLTFCHGRVDCAFLGPSLVQLVGHTTSLLGLNAPSFLGET